MSGPATSVPAHRRGVPIDRRVSDARIRAIVEELAKTEEGVKAAEVFGPSRRHPVCRVRWRAMAVIRAEFPSFTFERIGRIFGRDHTTVIHGLRRNAE